MKTCHEPPTSAPVRVWALEQLGVPPGADVPETRARLLRKLTNMEFVPNETWMPAWRLVKEVVNVQLPTSFTNRQEAVLRERVETFAVEFFRLQPNARQARYRLLTHEVSSLPALAHRLERLAPGLGIEVGSWPDLDVDARALAEWVCEGFTKPYRLAVVHRQELLTTLKRNPGKWDEAARQLCAVQAKVAALDVSLMETIVNRARPEGCPVVYVAANGAATGVQFSFTLAREKRSLPAGRKAWELPPQPARHEPLDAEARAKVALTCIFGAILLVTLTLYFLIGSSPPVAAPPGPAPLTRATPVPKQVTPQVSTDEELLLKAVQLMSDRKNLSPAETADLADILKELQRRRLDSANVRGLMPPPPPLPPEGYHDRVR